MGVKSPFRGWGFYYLCYHFTLMHSSVKIFSGNASIYLAEKIAKHFGKALGALTIQKFSDGEFQPVFQESIRGDYVFLVQATFSPSDNLMELQIGRASCRE